MGKLHVCECDVRGFPFFIFLRSHSERLHHKSYEEFAPSYVPSRDRTERGTSPTRHYVIGKRVRNGYTGLLRTYSCIVIVINSVNLSVLLSVCLFCLSVCLKWPQAGL